MAFTDQYALANDAVFQSKVRIAICSAAQNVCSEALSGHNLLDEKRHALSVSVLIDGGLARLPSFSFAVASFGTITSQSVDSDIQFVVNSLWNDMAGVSAQDSK